MCFRFLPSAPAELPEPQVAVGGQRAHPELGSPGKGVIVVALGRFCIGRVGVRVDLAEQAENLGLMSPCILFARQIESTVAEFDRIINVTGTEIGLTQRDNGERIVKHCARSGRLFHNALQKGQGLGEAPGQRICIAQLGSGYREHERNIRNFAQSKTTFEDRSRRAKFPSAEVEDPEAGGGRGNRNGGGAIPALGDGPAIQSGQAGGVGRV
jgi:hypothetical protein